jgi:hypothetical protein
MKDVGDDFESWVEHAKRISIPNDARLRTVELMEKVLEEMEKEAEATLKLGGEVSEDTVLGTDAQTAFDEFLMFSAKYRPN